MRPAAHSIVLDTTVLVSAFLTSGGVSAELLRLAERKCVTLFASEEILEETRQSLLTKDRIRRKYPYTDDEVVSYIAGLRQACTTVTEVPTVATVTKDPDDVPILACALGARAEYLISRDPHLLDLRECQGLHIVTPETFMGIHRAGQDKE